MLHHLVPTHDNQAARVHLLLGAGGVRCLSYIGALMQLREEGYEFASVSTASAGTLVGALHCSGVSPETMLKAALEMDLGKMAGEIRWKPLRRVWTLRTWPYALYREPGIVDAFSDIVSAAGGNPDPTLGELSVPLSTAAVDVAGMRLLVYSSEQHPDMRVRELLRIAVAIPLMYRPHERQGREVMDASLASPAPVWLAAGQLEDLPIVVLRTLERRQRRRRLVPWLGDVIQSGVSSRDTFDLERLPRVRVYDIETDVPAFKFDLSRTQVSDLVALGRRTVAAREEIGSQTFIGPSDGAERRAEQEAAGLFRRHLDRLARDRKPTVFISYAREDAAWVTRVRSQLDGLLADTSVDVWDDSYVRPGALWRGTIEDAIARARVGVLFVSEHFRRSDFIRETELELLRAASSAGRLRLLWLSVDGTRPAEPEEEIQALDDPVRPLATLVDVDATAAIAGMARTIEEAYRSFEAAQPES
jgi:predicted acylesterase/phospholipase RssA